MELSSNAQIVAEKRYFKEGEDWDKLALRVGGAAAANEENKSKWTDIFASEIANMSFIPGGRILRNSGKIKQSVLNCACLPISDSIEEIGETIKNALILWSYGAGIGIDFSPLRPKGVPLKSKGGESSGMISFLKAIDSVASTIETGGQRRSGCLAMCKVSHPEIFDFIKAKLVDKELSYFNLSVAVDSSFLNAVENNVDWDLRFEGRVFETIKARDLWKVILDSMISSGDPGIINYDNLIKNNSFYFQNISCVNLCSELPLPAYGMCCLGSLVLPNFVPGIYTNWKGLGETIRNAVRFLDNIIDINYYPIGETARVSKDSRRIGLGVMGLHDYLLKKKIRYGSEESLDAIERLFKFIRDTAYIASADLAEEKGAFPKYSRTQYHTASFVKKLPPKIRMYIKDKAVRNCSMLSCPPTGTTSLVANVSSGIEPIFALAYKRKDRVGERIYIHPTFKELVDTGEKIPEWLTDSFSLTPQDHFEVQCTIERFLDNACSKTINCPSNTTTTKLSKLLLEYVYDLVGITAYVDGCKGEQPLQRIPKKDIGKYIDKAEIEKAEEEVQCKNGTCEL